jgi:hypothetical protein
VSQDDFDAMENAYQDVLDALQSWRTATARHALLAVTGAPDDVWPRYQQMRKWNVEIRDSVADTVSMVNKRIKGTPKPKRDQTGRYAYYQELRERNRRK